MNTELNKVLLLGIGETGRDVGRIIVENKTKEITVFGIKNESDLKPLAGNVIEEAELVLLVANLGNKKVNSLALQAATFIKGNGKVLAAILTTPPHFEGMKAVIRALETAFDISREADTSLIIKKETFNRPPEKGCTFAELINSLVSVEETIADCIQNMMTLISKTGKIKIDVHDLKTTLAESDTFTIGRGSGAGENRVGLAMEQVLSSPLMKTCDIFTIQRVLIKVFAPKDTPIIVDEMKGVSEFIETLPPHADVKWGVGESDDDGIVSIIVLASGFDVPLPE